MSQEIQVTFFENNQWTLPFNVAVGLHLLLIFSAVYLPQYINKKPIYPDIYTIDLIGISEPLINAPETKLPQQPPAKKPAKVKLPSPKAKKLVNTNSSPPVVVTKPVSIKPFRRKRIKNPVQPKKKLEQIHKKNIDEANQAERLAEEEAKIAAAEAVDQLKRMIQESESIKIPPQTTSPKPPQTSRIRNNNNVVESQHFAAIINKLQPYWSLPEYKDWDPALVAIIVIQVEKDGTISKQFFEKKSGDKFFDQFVLKTLQKASPLPPIPTALQKDRLEIGLRFRPGGIQ